jgi:RNA polymerase sigma-70 factor (ECF subfamily)
MRDADRKLVAKVLSGDERAVREFSERVHADIFSLLMWLTRDPDTAENLTQESFARIWERLSQFRGDSNLRTWTHKIAYSLLLSHRRDTTRESRLLCEYASATEHNSADAAERAAMRLTLAAALGQLPDEQARVVVLCKLQGLTLAEAARIVSEPVGTLAWRLAEAMRKLRELLGEESASQSRSAPARHSRMRRDCHAMPDRE